MQREALSASDRDAFRFAAEQTIARKGAARRAAHFRLTVLSPRATLKLLERFGKQRVERPAMTVSPNLEQLIEDKVASGEYSSPEAVLRESLLLLQERDDFRRFRLESLRRDIEVGLRQAENGETLRFDPDDLKRRIRERLTAGPRRGPELPASGL